ncbi:MAG: alpha/beta hydrolase [unclassified Hahellaceae]|nr:alpha/beta hydrolase [Hahellaceae bacterium]|tara:strand:+ start:84274 stop:85191 length:918 start_codon:yes stop_codon:yes gene_type:complete
MFRLVKKLNVLALIIPASGCSSPASHTDIEAKYRNAQSQTVQVTGMKIHYRDEGSGEPILLLHGTGSSLHTWDQWASSLAPHYRVIRVDLPGSGLTEPHPAAAYEVADDVRFVHAFLEQLGVDKVHIAGNSLGGRIAWQFAVDHPEQTQTLTLLNALGYPQDSWPPAIQFAQYPVFDTLMASYLPRFAFTTSLRDIYHDKDLISDELVDRYYEISTLDGKREAFTQRVKARLDQDSALIPQVQVPALILWGEEDKYFPVKNAYRFHEDIAGSRLVVYQDVAHLPMEEVPRQSATDFEGFLREHPL